VGPAPKDRFLRLLAGSALFVLAFVNNFAGWYLILAGIGATIAFTAVYDRCPIYKAVSGRLKALLGKSPSGQTKP
jgi:thioredoxin 1